MDSRRFGVLRIYFLLLGGRRGVCDSMGEGGPVGVSKRGNKQFAELYLYSVAMQRDVTLVPPTVPVTFAFVLMVDGKHALHRRSSGSNSF